jgi:hypothetical protein
LTFPRKEILITTPLTSATKTLRALAMSVRVELQGSPLFNHYFIVQLLRATRSQEVYRTTAYFTYQ